jgi:hypothetical protein
VIGRRTRLGFWSGQGPHQNRRIQEGGSKEHGKPKIHLCLGRDAALQETRRAVLTQSGYDAQSARTPDGYQQLGNGPFDLVIVFARLAEQSRNEFLSALPAETQTLVVKEFSIPKRCLPLWLNG